MDMQTMMGTDNTIEFIQPTKIDNITMYEIFRVEPQQWKDSDLIWIRDDGVELSQAEIEAIHGEEPFETFFNVGEMLDGLAKDGNYDEE